MSTITMGHVVAPSRTQVRAGRTVAILNVIRNVGLWLHVAAAGLALVIGMVIANKNEEGFYFLVYAILAALILGAAAIWYAVIGFFADTLGLLAEMAAVAANS